MTTDELFNKYAKAGKVGTTVNTVDDRGQKVTYSIAGNCNDLSDSSELVKAAQLCGATVSRKGAFATSKAKEVAGDDAAANLAHLLGVEVKPRKKPRGAGADTVQPETNGHATEVN